jgi:epoxyqueuosine reductase
MEEGDRLDPRTLLDGVHSALVGFFPYARPDAVPGAVPGSLKVSRYLWGRDYHQILKARLQRLLAEAQAMDPRLEGRVCVDTAPLLERQMAVRAGLGWQGRNTLFIAGKDGSWGFLGVLLLSCELLPDTPFAGHRCGVCQACLDACPTGALSSFRLDPGRCLTTFNLETEVEPPRRVLEAMRESRWVAGCDLCQEVCPWNQTPLWGDGELWGGESPLHTLPADALPRRTAQWQKISRKTALRRVRHRHWLTNLGRVLGHGEE